MNKEKFSQLKVGDKIKYQNTIIIDNVIGFPYKIETIKHMYSEGIKTVETGLILPRSQIICRVVKKKRIHETIDRKYDLHDKILEIDRLKEQLKKYEGLEQYGYSGYGCGGFFCHPYGKQFFDTHEVWIRPIPEEVKE